MKIWGAPASVLYSMLMGTRNKFYDWGLFRSVKVDAPVIVVGNVTVGGTGKTPVIILLAEKVMEKYPHVGVISRGYKRKTKGAFEVELGAEAVRKFGDEPVLIKTRIPKAMVVVAEKRVVAARTVLAKNDKAILFADDALQHRQLARDLNILLLDALDEPQNYHVIPWGRARESLKSALRRADYLVLTKANLIGPDELVKRLEWLKGLTEKPILQALYVLDGFSMGNQWQESLSDKVYLVSAVARPESVDRLLEGRLQIVKHKVFGDHHHFTDLDVETVLDEASQAGARWVVCTEKDSIKLKLFPRLEGRLWVIKLKVKLEGEANALYEEMSRLARTRS